MAEVFVSYSSRDRNRVRPIVIRLRELQIQVAWDQDIRSGESWADRIEAELSTAKCVLVLWSTSSVASDVVREEVLAARHRNALVAALIDRCTPPLGHARHAAIDLSMWRSDFTDPTWLKLVDEIAQKANRKAVAQWEAVRAEIETHKGYQALVAAADRAQRVVAANRDDPVMGPASAYLRRHEPEIRNARKREHAAKKKADRLAHKANVERIRKAVRAAAIRAFFAANVLTISALAIAVVIGAGWAWRHAYSLAALPMRGEAERLTLPLGHLDAWSAEFGPGGEIVVESARLFSSDEGSVVSSVWSAGGDLLLRSPQVVSDLSEDAALIHEHGGLSVVRFDTRGHRPLDLNLSGSPHIQARLSGDGAWVAVSATQGDGNLETRRAVTAGVWSVESGGRRSTLERGANATGAIRIAAISADGSRVAGENGPNEFVVWDGRTGRKLMSRRFPNGAGTFDLGNGLVSVFGTAGSFVVDIGALAWLGSGHGCLGTCRAVRDGGRLQLIDVRRTADGGVIRMWQDGRRREFALPAGEHYCEAAISHSGLYVALARGRGCRTVTLYRLAGDEFAAVRNWPIASEPNLEFSPDDQSILVTDQFGVLLLDAANP